VEKGPNGEEIPNRTHTPVGTQTLDLTVATWADGPTSTITGDVTTFTHAPFLNGRRVWVYLPPGYHDQTAAYPVLYMHDGQNLFDQTTSFAGEWRVDEACEALIAAGEIEPVIVVGIDNGPNRCGEYTPWFDSGIGCGGQGDAYLAAIRDILIPEIERRYRARPGEAYMAGSSLGGLISAYAGYADSTWSRIAAVSPSYWFNGAEMVDFAESAGRPASLERFYHDFGTAEGSLGPFNAMHTVAVAQGFTEGDDYLAVVASGHTHSETYWAQRFPDILRFLIDPPSCGPADLNDDGTLDLADLNAFVGAFLSLDPLADIDEDGEWDLTDIALFIAAFNAGCAG
jgi:predicted alpha/beta superfamily hydrolase